ncbi:uncharacterized protein LOC119164870 [Rhipicephalus microplus]|uniref:uncharacterized protein LOC119164870 n=1 Tax=Rhipicephalus microplus TaxID=6941 RepID=UPI003F6B3E0E
MESSSLPDCNESVEAVEEVANKKTVQAEINTLQQTPSVSAENYNPEPAEPATPENMQASGYALAGERVNVPPEELENYGTVGVAFERPDERGNGFQEEPESHGAVGYSYERQDELFPEDEHEEPADSPAYDGFTQFTSERLGARVHRLAEKIAEHTGKVSQNSENLVLRVSARRDDLLRRNEQQKQNIDTLKSMVLDNLKKYSKDGE